MRQLDLRTYPRYIIYSLYILHRSSFIIHRSMSYILHPATINPHMYMYARIQHIVKTSMSAADIPSELTLRRDVQHAGFWMALGPACRLADRPSELTLSREVHHAGLPASHIHVQTLPTYTSPTDLAAFRP